MIMLLGLVAKNAILIVDFANQLKSHGHRTVEALVIAGKARLRPILMTTIAMVFGMMPIALAEGAGAEWKNGLAWALVGGLTSSMLLTVFVVPAVYMAVDIIKSRVNRRPEERPRKSELDAIDIEAIDIAADYQQSMLPAASPNGHSAELEAKQTV
jgi:HAE1 family hydrophobic/amphiphilic exporter-1